MGPGAISAQKSLALTLLKGPRRLPVLARPKESLMKSLKSLIFGCGFMLGLTTLSVAFGAVPSNSRVTDDTALYENLSEIRVSPQHEIRFEGDISNLRQIEGRYKERLPALRRTQRLDTLQAPAKRISEQKYRRTNPS